MYPSLYFIKRFNCLNKLDEGVYQAEIYLRRNFLLLTQTEYIFYSGHYFMSVARNGSHLSNRPAKLRPTLLSPPRPLLLSAGAPFNGYLKST